MKFQEIIKYLPYAYFLIISLVAIIVCAHDKRVSKIKGHRRVPEATLLSISILGGSVAMLITMLTIRHKTKHIKFMLGIPLIILAQIAVIVFVL